MKTKSNKVKGQSSQTQNPNQCVQTCSTYKNLPEWTVIYHCLFFAHAKTERSILLWAWIGLLLLRIKRDFMGTRNKTKRQG